jgi:hypothetical protein
LKEKLYQVLKSRTIHLLIGRNSAVRKRAPLINSRAKRRKKGYEEQGVPFFIKNIRKQHFVLWRNNKKKCVVNISMMGNWLVPVTDSIHVKANA